MLFFNLYILYVFRFVMFSLIYYMLYSKFFILLCSVQHIRIFDEKKKKEKTNENKRENRKKNKKYCNKN